VHFSIFGKFTIKESFRSSLEIHGVRADVKMAINTAVERGLRGHKGVHKARCRAWTQRRKAVFTRIIPFELARRVGLRSGTSWGVSTPDPNHTLRVWSLM
jgi:hypothetical protein